MHFALITVYTVVQAVYLAAVLTTIWFFTMPVNLIATGRKRADPGEHPRPDIVLFYPVLNELEATMRTTFTGMTRAPYRGGRVTVVSIPNDSDLETIASLRRLQKEFDFLQVMPVPPTSDASWNAVWDAWDAAPGAYWWHQGKRAGDRALPPKKTRQLIWAMYQLAPGNEDALLSYIDADSVIPIDYWDNAAIGMSEYDVVQNTNITGNLLQTWPTSFYAMDHIAWDSTLYRHMTADGKHPFYVLGKGLFFRFRDLLEVGGFHPWLTIEDPEIGMRLWTNGARLGVVESPLVEEVPATWTQGVTQRKRWVAGFFQSLGSPLVEMGMPLRKRMRARLNFVPCLSLSLNPIGFAIGIWALVEAFTSDAVVVPVPVQVLTAITVALAACLMGYMWRQSYRMTARVLPGRRARLRYSLRVNPLFQLWYWLWWAVPLTKGLLMFLRDGGLVWERTEKRDANHELVRSTHQDVRRRNDATEVPEIVDAVETPSK